MQKAFLSYIRKHELTSYAPILIGVSGGRDSVVLCDLYHCSKIQFAIAHCNFGLRHKESDEDALFVEKLAQKYQVPFYTVNIPTQLFAKQKGISIQMSAREQRVDWFKNICIENGMEYYATAHHQDDAIETYLINQIRGTGISGLHGILPKQNQLIHPLLFASRKDITKYAEENQLQWRDDSSNSQTKYTRNKIRHQVLPLLEEINKEVRNNFLANMERIISTENIYHSKIKEYKNEICLITKTDLVIDLNKLISIQESNLVLFEIIKEYGYHYKQCEQILRHTDGSQNGALFSSPTHQLLRDRDALIIKKHRIKDEKIFLIESIPCTLTKPIFLEINYSDQLDIISDKNIAQLDATKVSLPLQMRKWKKGDYFYPLGMHRRKKLLSDYFIDQKMSLFEKQNTWILCSGEDIIWLIGHRIDNRFKISSKTTKSIIINIISPDC